MSKRHSGGHAESGSVRSSRGSSWRERKQKEREDREPDRQEEMSGTGGGSYQTQRTVSGATRYRQRVERDEELERLRRLVKDLELEVRGRRRRRNRDDQQREAGIRGNRYGEGSNHSESRLRRSRSLSREYNQYRDRL